MVQAVTKKRPPTHASELFGRGRIVSPGEKLGRDRKDEEPQMLR
jgi:hypothetical protein